MTEGFYPIQDMIWDTAQIKLKQLYEQANDIAPVIAVNTDCVFVRVRPECVMSPELGLVRKMDTERPNEILQKLKKRMNDVYGIKSKDFDFGKVGIEQVDMDKICQFNTITFKENELDTYEIVMRNPETDEFKLEDEWNFTENDFKEMELRSNLMFRADYPGCGKTHLALDYANRIAKKEEIAIVCAWNSLKHSMEDKGYFSMTSYAWFGMTPALTKPRRLNGFCHKGFKVIVFDELNLNDQNMLSIIRDFMERHPEIRYLATGNMYQCEPIDLTLNNVKLREYINDITIINRMFSNVCRLTEVKRATCKTHLQEGFQHDCQLCKRRAKPNSSESAIYRSTAWSRNCLLSTASNCFGTTRE
jgi:hypothetical protein